MDFNRTWCDVGTDDEPLTDEEREAAEAEAWAAIKDGRLGGVSVEGGAKRRKPAAAAVAGLRS